MNPSKLYISQKTKETNDAYSFLLDKPEDGSFDSIAGQYITLSITLDGKEHRRAYSLHTRPQDGKVGFAVKRVKGGLISNYLIDEVKQGDSLAVFPPEGRFVLRPEVQAVRDHYFFAAGSGITPVMSMISTMLEEEPLSTCYLLYGNHNEDCIIFRDQLDALAENHTDQFVLQHTLSQPHAAKSGGLMGLLGIKAAPTWRGAKGRIDRKMVAEFMREHPSKTGNNLYYLCGPGGMIETVETALLGQDVNAKEILKEYFSNPDEAKTTTGAGGSCQAEVTLNGETFSVKIPADKSVLDALIDLGKDPPYSCTSGACSTCMAKVSEGAVEMEACFALDDEEVEDGYVLACQAKCTTPTLKIEFEV